MQKSSGKAESMDGIPVELYKAAGPVTLTAFHDTITKTRAVEQIVAITEEYLFSPLQETLIATEI